MKKTLFFILAAALVLAVSCNKSESGEAGYKSLAVTVGTGAQYAPAWKAGDAISVNGTASKPLAAGVAAGKPAQFKVPEEVAAPYNVIYPASSVSGAGQVTIPSMQSYSEDHFDSEASIMTGYSATENISLKLACAGVKVSIARAGEEAISQIYLFSKGEEALAGEFKADCNAGTLTYVSGASSVVIMSSVAFDEMGKIKAVFAIPAGTYQKGFSIIAAANDGSSIGKSEYGGTGVTIQAGNVLEIPEISFTPVPKTFSGGEGTEERPYLIGKAADLVALSALCSDMETNPEYHSAFYKQNTDIDMTGVDFASICSEFDDATAFAGVYDGAGHKISNLSIISDAPNQGLFGCARGAKIKNVILDKCSVAGSSRLGAIAGAAWKGTEILDCKVMNSNVRCESKDQVGGIVGHIEESSVRGCEVTGSTIKADANYSAGAIAGETGNASIISGCSVSACDIFAVQCAGGIAGKTLGGQIQNCVVKGGTKINTTERSAGGIGGGVSTKTEKTVSDLVIDNCLVTEGTFIKSLYYSGGIVGYVYPGDNMKFRIRNCGVENSDVCTKTDDGSAHKGDCCIGGMIGWLRNSSGSSDVKILNNYIYFAEGGCKVDEEGISNLAIAGVVGYISNSATSRLEISGNCTDLAKVDIVVAGKAYSGEDPAASKIGSVYGHCAHDYNKMNVSRNYWVNDTGILTVGHSGLTNVVIEENEGFTTSVFQNGTTVVGKLNAFAAEYRSEFEEEELNDWTIKDNRPVLIFKF